MSRFELPVKTRDKKADLVAKLIDDFQVQLFHVILAI